MMTTLKDRTVLITGASAGIGKACADVFARFGARLLLCARRIDRLYDMEEPLRAQGAGDVMSLEVDVRSRDDVSRVLGRLSGPWCQVDLLVNNAGLSRGLHPIYEGEIDDWEEMIDTNIKGLLYVSRVVMPGMVERGAGHIINIGSIAGHEVYPRGNVYCATKSAVDAITRGMIVDLHGTGVRVTTVDPGLVETEFSSVRFRGDVERAAAVYRGTTPLRPEDVAEAVAWCATRPAHVAVREMILTATDQASATLVRRTTA